MNKKVLSAILFSALFAGTGTFTSCIDNDEPAGIEELRGAKAELIRAKVAVEQAEAARILAVAEVEKANAAKAAALAKQEEAKAKIEEAKAEAEAATTAEAKAKAEKAIAEYQQQMEIAALDHQASILAKQEALAKAERSYELAMKQIEIAKAVMSEKDKVTIAMLEAEVLAAKVQYDGAVEKYRIAENAHYDAAILADNETGWEIDYAEWHLKYAKADLAAAEKTLAKYAEFEKNEGVETADWRAEIQEIEDSLVQIAKAEAKVELEKQQALNSKEFKAYVDTVYAADAALALEKDTLKSQFKFAEAVKDTMLYTTTWNVAGEKDKVFEVYKDANKAEALKKLAGESYMTFNIDSTAVTVAENYGEHAVITKLENERASYTTEKIFWLKKIAASDSANLAKIKADADSAVVKWEEALAAYNAADTTVATKLAAANEALDAFSALGQAEKTPTAIDAARKAILAYYTAAKANGATFGKVPAKQARITVEENGSPVYKTPYALEDAMTVLADTSKTYSAITEFLVEFTSDASETLKVAETDESYYDATSKTDKKLSYNKGAITKQPKGVGASADTFGASTYLGELQQASFDAFGSAQAYVGNDTEIVALQMQYLHTKPNANDAKYVGYDNAGEYGEYLASLDEDVQFVANNYEAIIADLEAAKAKWVALVAEIVAEAQTATADIKAAKIAKGTAELNLSNYSASITKVQNLALAELGGEKRALEAIKSALVVAVNAYLSEGEYQNAAQFEAWLAKQVKDAEFEVILAKAKVTEKENNLKQAQDGKFTAAEALAAAERELAAAEEVLAEAEEDLTEALENLEKGITIMAGSAE